MENMEFEHDVKFHPIKNTFLLNTNTSCFLCLRTNHDFNDSQDKINRVSLLSICRYLGVRLSDLFSNSLDSTNKSHFLGKIPNLVKLCEGCALITSKLSSLCHELEVLQMKVDHCLQSFLDKLEDSEMDTVLVQRFLKTKSEQLEGNHVNLAETLRKEMQKKCDMKLNSILPKVKIKGQVQGPTKKILLTPQLPEISPSKIQNHPGISTGKTKSKPKTKFRFKRGEVRKQHICILCQPPISIANGRLDLHEIRMHIDQLLNDYKLPNTSSDDFKIYANHVQKVEVISSKKGVNSKGAPICHCPHCPSTYASHQHLKVHLYYQHKDILTKKLIELQKSSTVEEIQSIQLPSLATFTARLASSKKFNCDKCGKLFNHKDSLDNHKKYYCKFGPKIQSTDPQKCEQCGTVCSAPNILVRHKNYYCKFGPKIHRTHVPVRPQKCEHCGMDCSSRSVLLRHKKHYCKFGPKMKKIEKPATLGCQVCGEKFKYPSHLKAHQKKSHSFLESKSSSKVTSTGKLHEIGESGVSVEIEFHSEKSESENADDFEQEMEEGDYGDIQDQDRPLDVVVKTEHYNDNVDFIIPDILEDRPF